LAVELRRIGTESLTRVAALEKACFPGDFWSRATLKGVLARWSDSVSVGAFAQDELLGYVSAALDEPHEVHLLSLAVAPEYRGRGIASRLVSSVLHWGRMRGCRRAFLEVRVSSGSARAAYERLGFSVRGNSDDYYEDGEAALLMSRGLAPEPEVAGMAAAIRDILDGRVPRVGVVLGSGIGWLAGMDEPGFTVPYGRIPGMSGSQVEGHQGNLLVNAEGSTVYLMGRRHHYQGYDGRQVAALPAALASLGVDSWLLTTSAGAVVPGLRTGDMVVITDHVNLSGCIPSAAMRPVGTSVYSRRLGAKTVELAAGAGIPVREGVFSCVSGPAYETGSEVGLLADSGVDVVSMSTVQEALALASQGCEVIGIALVTNDVGSGAAVNHAEVLRAQTSVRTARGALLRELVKTLVKGK